MGAPSKHSIFNHHAKRLGDEAAAVRIQELFRSDKRLEAAAALPGELVDVLGLIGPKGRIRGRLAVWIESRRVASGGLQRKGPKARKFLPRPIPRRARGEIATIV